MSFGGRPSLGERLRGKSTDELIKEMRDSMDESKKKFFDKSRPSWFSESSASSRRFPFDDEDNSRRRGDLDFHLDRLAEEHPDIAEPLRNFRSDKSSKKKRTEDSSKESTDQKKESTSEASGGPSTQPTATEPKSTGSDTSRIPIHSFGRPLDTKLRNTVPDMRREQEGEEERVSRSQSAPPSQEGDPQSVPLQGQHQPPPQREPVVCHIPIFVEGRDEPVINKDFVDSGMGRDKRNISRESSPVPPTRRSTHTPDGSHQPTAAPKHKSSVHINHTPPPDRTVPIEVTKPQPHHHHQPQQQHHQPQPQQPQQKQTPPPQPTQNKPMGPLDKVQAVQQEVSGLMNQVEGYKGTSRKDKEYVYLDEMLTRNLLKLDDIETEGKEDVRAARKEAIRQIQRCISHLESKAPVNGAASSETSDSTRFELVNPPKSEKTDSTETSKSASTEAITNLSNTSNQNVQPPAPS